MPVASFHHTAKKAPRNMLRPRLEEAWDVDSVLNNNHSHAHVGGWATECEMTSCAWDKRNYVFCFAAVDFPTLPGLMFLAQWLFFYSSPKGENQVSVYYQSLRMWSALHGPLGPVLEPWSGVWWRVEWGMEPCALGMLEALCCWNVSLVLFLLLVLR